MLHRDPLVERVLGIEQQGQRTLAVETDLDPRRQRLFYWLIIAFSLALWGAIAWFANKAVPLIANVQGSAS